MAEILEDIEYKWELINRLINKNWEVEDCIFSFNVNGKKEYSKKEINNLIAEKDFSYYNFSNLVHQMPTSKIFKIDDNLLWKEYQKIFYCGTIAKQNHDDNSKLDLDIDQKKINTYTRFEKEHEVMEEKYLEALEGEKSEAQLQILRKRLKDKNKDWIADGYKKEVEEIRYQLSADGNYSYASQWSKWKSLAEYSWVAGHKGPHSMIGAFTANFQNLLDDKWQENYFAHKQLDEAINGVHIVKDNKGLKQLRKKVEIIKFKSRRVFVERNWFERNIFTSKFWKWRNTFNGSPLSDGNLKGSLPSYVKEVIFLKDIKFRERSNMVFDLLEWVGGGFSELNYESFIENEKNEIFLTAFICEKTPKCPSPDSRLEFN